MNISLSTQRAKDVVAYLISPQILVLVTLYVLLTAGIQYLHFDVTWTDVLATALAAAVSELVLAMLLKNRMYFPSGALTAAAGICIFFRATHWYYFALAALVAVASKYLFKRSNGAHVFNPSNIAIVSMVFLFPSASTIEFTQWGNSIVVYAVVAAVCLFVSYRAGKLGTTLSFLFSYFALLLLLLPYVPEELQAHHFGMLGPSLILFACFMITDPRTSPRERTEMLLHGGGVAMLFFVLEMFGVRYSLFVASFLITVLNLFSGIAPTYLGERLAFFRNSNAASFIAVSGLALLLFIPVFLMPPRFNPLTISPRFIALGVESEALLRCSPDAAFQKSDAPSLGVGMSTYGAAWGDYDNDGFDDLFVSSVEGAHSRLYRNSGSGTFDDVTESAGLPSKYSSSGFFVDFDNDGLLDLFVLYESDSPTYSLRSDEIGAVRASSVSLYKNFGDGGFKNISEGAGLSDLQWSDGLMATASFSDYDVDGDLDIVVATRGHLVSLASAPRALLKSWYDPFFNQSRTAVCDAEAALRELETTDAAEDETALQKILSDGGCLYVRDGVELFADAYPFSPPSFGGQSPNLQINIPGELHLLENRNNIFVEHTDFNQLVQEEVAKRTTTVLREGVAPYDAVSGRFYQPVSFDYNDDGRPDIFVSSSRGSPLLLRNDGGLNFSVQTAESGLNRSGNAMGADIADYNRDGYPDIASTNVRSDFLYAGTREGMFSLQPVRIGALGLGWGVSFLDYDLDGWDDIIETNGVFFGMSEQPSHSYILPFFRIDRLYRNDTSGGFDDRTGTDFCPGIESGRALAVSDFDNNGTPDVFIGTVQVQTEVQENNLYVNTLKGGAYVKVRLVGQQSNRFGIGAVVSVSTDTATQSKIVLAGSSYYSQNSNRLIFGLGKDSSNESFTISVLWPSGIRTQKSFSQGNREVVLYERI